MANYYETVRTNYFKVKDDEEFRGAIEALCGLMVHDRGDGRVCVLAVGDFGFPTEDASGEIEVDMVELIASHLCDNEICVVKGSGHEKLAYVDGYAQAFDNKGEFIQINLNDIYKMAGEKFGPEATITDASN